MNFESLAADLAEWSSSMIESFGYLGVFIVNFVGSSTIIFPLPGFIVVTAVASMPGMNPWLVGISAGIGAALGETTGYIFGRGGGKIIDRKYSSHMEKYRKWFRKDNIFFGVIIFAATPLPDDIVGLVCGMFKYDFKKFMLASLIGKLILNLGLAFLGFYGAPWIFGALSTMDIRSAIAVTSIIVTGTLIWFKHRKGWSK